MYQLQIPNNTESNRIVHSPATALLPGRWNWERDVVGFNRFFSIAVGIIVVVGKSQTGSGDLSNPSELPS